jgi:hypothetical protein
VGGEREGPRATARVFDVEVVRRVPGGIASHRMTLAVLGPDRPPTLPDQRR